MERGKDAWMHTPSSVKIPGYTVLKPESFKDSMRKDSMDMNLGKFWETVRDREPGGLWSLGSHRVGHN